MATTHVKLIQGLLDGIKIRLWRMGSSAFWKDWTGKVTLSVRIDKGMLVAHIWYAADNVYVLYDGFEDCKLNGCRGTMACSLSDPNGPKPIVKWINKTFKSLGASTNGDGKP